MKIRERPILFNTEMVKSEAEERLKELRGEENDG